jgi:iron-sulfur cluster assembly accessory protein
MIHISTEAIMAAKSMQKEEPDYQGKALRVYLSGKECHGFVYGVCFDKPGAKDITFSDEGVDIIVDEDSYVFLKEATVSWVDDERGRGFLVENPKEKNFRGKFFKKQSWQDYLLARRSKIEPGNKDNQKNTSPEGSL